MPLSPKFPVDFLLLTVDLRLLNAAIELDPSTIVSRLPAAGLAEDGPRPCAEYVQLLLQQQMHTKSVWVGQGSCERRYLTSYSTLKIDCGQKTQKDSVGARACSDVQIKCRPAAIATEKRSERSFVS